MFEGIVDRFYDFLNGYRSTGSIARCAEEVLRVIRQGEMFPVILASPVINHFIQYKRNIWFREGVELFYGLHQGTDVSIETLLRKIDSVELASFLKGPFHQ